MILYVSNVTSYEVYNKLVAEKKLIGGYQAQKFNDNILQGLSQCEKITAISCISYANVEAERIEFAEGNIRYIGIKNTKGKLHKIFNLLRTFRECKKTIANERPQMIICDAVAQTPCVISKLVGKLKKIPVIAIVTDLPGMMLEQKNLQYGLKRMQGFDGYIFLTEQMNTLINKQNAPYMIMEGLCAQTLPEQIVLSKSKKVILYAGSLWKHDAGIEYFTEGFIKANLSDVELHYYGTGELVPWIQEKSKECSNIKYMGVVSNQEMVHIQTEATLLVNPRPSNEEFCEYSFPSKTIEYMASGTPVLMTKLPGVPSEYFNYVYTIEKETAEGVCEILTSIFSSSEEIREEKGMEARKFVIENKNNKVQTKKIYQFVKELKK